MDVIYYLKGLVEACAHQSSDSKFEEQHLIDVEQAILKLCNRRGLTVEIGLIIAYGHDLGRLKAGVRGKTHSKVSAKLLKPMLKDSDFTKKEVKRICKAVRRHNQKEKIHGIYSELIKDADSMAHAREGLVDRDDFHEQVRVLFAETERPTVVVANMEDWKIALEKSYSKIVKCINDDIAFSAESEFWVHDLRVAIRKMRSILWVIKHQSEFNSSENLKRLDSHLEKMAKTLEYVRILQVALRKAALDNETYNDFQEQVTREFINMGRHFDALFSLDGVKEQLEILLDELPAHLDESCYDLLDKTFRLAESVDLNRSKKLHTLRIYSKRLKYLSQMGLIQVVIHNLDKNLSELPEETFVELSDLLGDIHDIYEFHQLIGKRIFSSELKVLKKEVKKRLFLMRKMSQLGNRIGGIM